MEDNRLKEELRKIPQVDHLMENERTKALTLEWGRVLVLKALKDVISLIKEEINEKGLSDITEDKIILSLEKKLRDIDLLKLKKVVNATGIVLHTNLGRAPLPKSAVDLVAEVAGSYNNLEYDLIKGERGKRQLYVENLFKELTGAEDCMVVNNNAAAVLLCLQAFSKGKEVLVSRGELVEIGGSFRIPDVIRQSGCELLEVGTTNKTKLSDYRKNISERTGILLKVHTSNYIIKGFTETVSMGELSRLAKEKNLLLMEDLGSGSLYDFSQIKDTNEHTVKDSLKSGADLITFSGDKLLGGPQAGVILGKKELISVLKSHPLARVLRCDKMTIAALQAVVEIYAGNGDIKKEMPVLSMIFQDEEELSKKQEKLMTGLLEDAGDIFQISHRMGKAEAGGGSLPGVTIDSPCVLLVPNRGKAHSWQEALRKEKVPVIVPINEDGLMFHVRTLSYEDIDLIIEEIKNVRSEEKGEVKG